MPRRRLRLGMCHSDHASRNHYFQSTTLGTALKRTRIHQSCQSHSQYDDISSSSASAMWLSNTRSQLSSSTPSPISRQISNTSRSAHFSNPPSRRIMQRTFHPVLKSARSSRTLLCADSRGHLASQHFSRTCQRRGRMRLLRRMRGACTKCGARRVVAVDDEITLMIVGLIRMCLFVWCVGIVGWRGVW